MANDTATIHVMISEEQLAEWERLANVATEGPWHRCLIQACQLDLEECCDRHHPNKCSSFVVDFMAKKNLEFVIAAREAVPALISEVRRLEQELDWMAKKHKSCNGSYMTEGVYSYCTRSYDDLKGGQTRCGVCWREAARKAVSHDQD